MSIVLIKNLTKTYPSFQLDKVSFSLESGKITDFIGRNGAGKTTNIKSMLNLMLTLSHKAGVLILDEPTIGLDPFSRDEFEEKYAKDGEGFALIPEDMFKKKMEKVTKFTSKNL